MTPIEKNIMEYVKTYAMEEPKELFLFDENEGYTIEELYHYAMNLGQFFAQNGVKPGDYVGLCGTRTKEAIAYYLALQTIGAVAVLCDPRLPSRQYVASLGLPLPLQHEIDFLDGKWLFDSKTMPKPADFSENADFKIWDKAKEKACIIFTSGSTGQAKGVIHSNYSLVNHIRNMEEVAGFTEQDYAMQLLPIFHAFGVAQVYDAIIHRVPDFFPSVLLPDNLCAQIEKYHITRMGLVPTFGLALVKAKQENNYDTSSMAISVLGGAPSSKEQFLLIQNGLGGKILPAYGMSECIGISEAGPWESDDDRAFSVGKPLPMTEVMLTEEGEIAIKGPSVFYGYVGEEPFDHSKYFHTGDLGRFDEKGFLHIVGRIKEIIIRNGNNISATALEQKLLSLPFVLEAAVVGVEDEVVGEVPAALLVLRDGANYDENEVTSLFNKLEMPKYIKVVDKLPLTSSGKPNKQKIKELFK